MGQRQNFILIANLPTADGTDWRKWPTIMKAILKIPMVNISKKNDFIYKSEKCNEGMVRIMCCSYMKRKI